MDKWNEWYKDVSVESAFRYGDTLTYEKGFEFLKTCGTVEDWGCGTGGFKRFFKNSDVNYVGLDGSDTPFSDRKVDLVTYTSQVDGIFMRHVLEHNYQWRSVLENALRSFGQKMCLVLFTPFSTETKEIAHNRGHGVDVPDISFRKEDLTDLFGGIDWSIETFQTNTGYGVEHIFFLNKKWLAFYTVQFGPDEHIHPAPSKKYACYYFTDRDRNFGDSGWIPIKLDVKCTEDNACMAAKQVKVLPGRYLTYAHTCYLDSKYVHVDEKMVERLTEHPVFFREHPFIFNSVWTELEESMQQERYKIQRDRYVDYINENIGKGLSPLTPTHLAGGFIVRDMKKSAPFDEAWFQHIQVCGLNDQISLFFVKQLFRDIVRSAPIEYGPLVHEQDTP